MEIVEKLAGVVRGLLDAHNESRMPATLPVTFPPDHPLAGFEAGMHVRERNADGTVTYRWHSTPRGDVRPQPALCEQEFAHRFDALADMVTWSRSQPEVRSVFVQGSPFEAHKVLALLEHAPQEGTVWLPIVRHPAWLRWASVVGTGGLRDLDHHSFGNLLVDNREDLDEPRIADLVRVLRGAKEVVYEGDLDSGESTGVRFRMPGTGGQEGASAPLTLPREFAASFPAFLGAWEPGAEPSFEARFRLRVMPPDKKSEDAKPIFRVLWVNAAEHEQHARAALLEAVRAAFQGGPVYLGAPDCARYVVPRVELPGAGK